jgi:uncharacterized protein (TIGR03437 family)
MHLSTTRSARLAALAASAALAAAALVTTIGATEASATPAPPTVTRIAPITAPEGTSIAMKIHGHRFDTTIGATTVAFDGTAAVSVDCISPSVCNVVTPNLSAGTVSVVVTTDGVALNPETLTVVPYAAPVVRLVTSAKGHTEFSVHHLSDGYPAQGAPGSDAFVLENSTADSQTVTNSTTGPITLAPGDSTTVALVADLGPYVFFTSGSPTSALTVKTK